MMKKEQLMVGDWVRCNCEDPFNGKVVQITEFGINVLDETPDRADTIAYSYPFEQIEPIPLTPEILEKNGFKQCRYNRPVWTIATAPLYISWTAESKRITIITSGQRYNNRINVDCPYVHTMQHALRLAGIEKYIEL